MRVKASALAFLDRSDEGVKNRVTMGRDHCTSSSCASQGGFGCELPETLLGTSLVLT
ncbi:hypothetical protein SynRS9909_00708 [Synechococcus sp. RS9909]|nr:hypothetical protein SynRS9909_00708 [Synechococcus sp. RS9909]